MSMLSAASINPIRATARFTQAEITALFTRALERRGYQEVSVSFLYDDKRCAYDQMAVPIFNATLKGTKSGAAPDQEIIDSDEMARTVKAELQADGHQVEKVSVSWSNLDRGASAEVILLIARKVN